MADPFQTNVEGVGKLVSSKENKIPTSGNSNVEGQTGEQVDALSLDLSDEKLLKIRNDLESNYASYESKLKGVWERNKESYLGKKKDGSWLDGEFPVAANLQFEAEETFLAAALAKNPEPVVWADNTPEGNAIAKSVKTMLAFHSDQLVLKRKLAFMVRQWSIYHLGVLKYGWSTIQSMADGNDQGDVEVSNRKIQNFIFDPDGYIDAYGEYQGAMGERIEVTAEKLVNIFDTEEEYIKTSVEGKMGTKVTYTEWWSADSTFAFVTYKDKVLDKYKNPYYNYPEIQEVMDPMTEEMVELEVNGNNHFSTPRKPFTFLSVYSLMEQPHDITGLVEQNIANQRKISQRSEQIGYNVAASNNGYAYSENNFNQETAKQAAVARAKGNPILIPQGGPINEAIKELPAQNLPSGIFNELEITKQDLRSSWGIVGITSTADDDDNTVRGEIIEQANDTSRISGGIGDAIEQVADAAFNWLTQLYYVFYDTEHFAAIMGGNKAVDYVTLTSENLDRQLIISVSPDSLKPKDETTEINMAQALFDKGAIGPKTLLTMLDFPDPDEAAADGILYKMDPMAYLQMNFPEVLQQMQQSQMQQQQQAMMGGPGGGDIPPEALTEQPGSVSRSPVENINQGGGVDISNVTMPSIPQGGPAG